MRTEARVTRVLSGDTVEVLLGSTRATVQYLGIRAPAAAASADYFGPEALQRNRQLVEGKAVALERDATDKNSAGQLVRYVWVGDQLINATLVREGYAGLTTTPDDRRYQGLLTFLQDEARRTRAGMWANPDRIGQSTAGQPGATAPPAGAAGASPTVAPTATPQLPAFAVAGMRYNLSPDRARLVVDLDRLLPDLEPQYKKDESIGSTISIYVARTVGTAAPLAPADAVVKEVTIRPAGVDSIEVRIELVANVTWEYAFARNPDRLVFDLKPRY